MGKKNKYKKEAAGQGDEAKKDDKPQSEASTSAAAKKESTEPPRQQQAGKGPPQQGQQQQQQRGPAQQGQQQRGPAQQGQQQQKQRGPAQQGQQQQGWGGQQQQGDRGPPQQGQQRGPPQQGQQQQQQRGPAQQGQQQQGWGGQHQQGGRGPPQQGQQQQQQQRGPPQQAWSGQQQQGGRGQQQQQQQRGPPPQGQQQYGSQRGPPQQQGRGGPGQQRPSGNQQWQGQQGGQGSRQTGGRQPASQGVFEQGSEISCAGIKRGTIGKPGKAEVNYLKMDLAKMPNIAYHYDVKIDPDKPKKFLRSAFEQFANTFLENICVAFDGSKSCYAVDKLPHLNRTEEVEILDSNGRKLHYKITVCETENPEIDLDSLRKYSADRIFDKPMRALQCLEVVLSTPCHNLAVRAGRSFFKRPDQPFDLGDGYEAWTGLYQAAILGDQPFLNIDISHKSFPKGMTIVDYIEKYVTKQKMNNQTRLSDWNLRNIKTFLKSISILYRPPQSFGAAPRSFKVNDISSKPAMGHTFKLETGEEISIAQYFKSRGYNLLYPQLPCLHVGSTARAIHVPMELCEIPDGQATNKKDGQQQVRQMIRFAATSTNERKEKIMNLLTYFNHNTSSIINRFGISIGQNFITIPTRVLPSPLVEYFKGTTVQPYNGAWQMSNNTAFLNTRQVAQGHKWAILHFGEVYNHLVHMGEMISAQGKAANMSLQPKPNIINVSNLDNTFEQLKKEKYDLVFVIIPGRGASYAEIKQKAELRYGLLTQCIKKETFERRMNSMLISNLLLKVNSKLNGINHKIENKSHVTLKNVMYLGADVTHPSPDQKHIPSVVGVAASHDAFGASYNMQYRLQGSAVEKIEDMESIVTEHLRVYKQYQKTYPADIIYYRDGVSDGQFPIVKEAELKAIQRACDNLKCKATITCIIVVKRHHTRFFPQGHPSSGNKFNNVEPGTVVDRVIVHPNEIQFFMVSHQSIQGTAKPTRYNVIENGGKFEIDLLQKLTYNLCHMFPRCNRVVSYPAPAYLAHLVAYRGRVYLEGTTRFQSPKDEYKKRMVNPNFMQSNPMYFV